MTRKEIRIFISSPGDVKAERDALKNLIRNDLQRTLGDTKSLYLNPILWEDLGRPGMGNIQDNLFKQLGDFNIFIGIFWLRFGTPTGTHDSGSEAEFRKAYEKWKQDSDFPILMYFCERCPESLNMIDTEQLDKVRTFRKEVESKGLTWTYKEVDELVQVVRNHLFTAIMDLV